MPINQAAINMLRANYDVKSPELKRVVDEECERIRAGRKPLAADKLRSKKIFLSLNEAELARIVEAIGTDEDLAREARKLALEAADARLAKRL